MNKNPGWLTKNSFEGKEFHNLTEGELQLLRERLKRFNCNDPEVSIAIPAYNEESNLFRTLSTLAANETDYKVEIIVINNNSSDRTQDVLDLLGVKNYFQPQQGIAYARQLGLEKAKGRYHLCADADTLYPPTWIDNMIAPMNSDNYIGVYGRYSILAPAGENLLLFKFYEFSTGILFRLRKNRREFINVLGFNFGFVTDAGRKLNGFDVPKVRKGSNMEGSAEYTEMSEDGFMAMQLATIGRLKFLTSKNVRVYTSARKVLAGGSITKVFVKKVKNHLRQLYGYYTEKSSA
jgi:glycosyltransferase involved in cell wall biosynthesis